MSSLCSSKYFSTYRYRCPKGTRGQFIFVQKHAKQIDEANKHNRISQEPSTNLPAKCKNYDVLLTVFGYSAVYQINSQKPWGPQLALTPVSSWHPRHSELGDMNPWIAFKMSRSFHVTVVVLDDRKGCCHDRFVDVEVTVGPSPNINDESNISCGTQSYQEDGVTTYE